MNALRVFYYGNYCLRFLAVGALFALTTACGIFSSGPINPKSTEHVIKFHHAEWDEVDPQAADKAYQNKKNRNILSFNSLCRETESPLDVTVENIFSELKNMQTLKKETITYQGVSAIESEVQGEMEGVKTFIRTLTFYKNNCTFDVLMVGKKPFQDKDNKAYRDFLDAVKFE